MAHPSVTIDLGELPRDQPPRVDGQWPGWVRLRHRLGRSPWRLVVAAAVAAATLVTLTTAAPLPPPPLSLHFAVSADSYEVDGEFLYAVEQPDPPSGQAVLTAYRLTDGSAAWRASHHALGSDIRPYRHGGSLLLLSRSRGPEDDLLLDRVTLLDDQTGAALWTVPGHPLPPAGDLLLVRETLAFDPAAGLRYAAVDTGTGEPVWQLEIAGWHAAVAPESRRLLNLDSAGELTAYDLATGAPIGSVTAMIDASAHQLQQFELTLHRPDSLALVTYTHGVESVVRAFDSGNLAPRWTQRYRADDLSGSGWLRVQSCAELICLGHRGPGMPASLDPATGERLWSVDWVPDRPDRGIILLPLQHPMFADYLLMRDSSRTPPGGWLVDTATGDPALEMWGWAPELPPVAAPGTPPLVVSRAAERPSESPTDQDAWVGVLRHDPLWVEPMGVIDRRYGHCGPRGGYVVCQAERGTGEGVTVWRVRA